MRGLAHIGVLKAIEKLGIQIADNYWLPAEKALQKWSRLLSP